jgi:hypothetical protein
MKKLTKIKIFKTIYICPQYCRAVNKNDLKRLQRKFLSKSVGCPPLLENCALPDA